MTSAQGNRFCRVLIVESRRPDRDRLCRTLEAESYETTVATTAAGAIAALEQGDFDAVLVGPGLPDLSALELLARIRDRHGQVPVILRDGDGSSQSSAEAMRRGAFSCVDNLDDPGESLREVHLACRHRFNRCALDLEAAVRARTEELARSNRELADFASVVAHDLRSPLLTLSGYCHLLRDGYAGRLDATADGYVKAIVDGAARMNRLIEDLLDYSRLGSSECAFEPIRLDAILAQVKANLEAMICQSGATIEIGPMPAVLGDQTQLAQLFQNLIANAIRFRGAEPPVIRISSARDGDRHVIRVGDNGIGIDSKDHDKVFQVFYRIAAGRREGGTGIGLAICKKIVQRHGGRIWLESELGRGATFLLTLPGAETDGTREVTPPIHP